MTLSQHNYSNNCLVSNFTCSDSYSLSAYVFFTFGVILMTLTVCGNLLVIISVCHFKQLHTPTNVLICSLAMSDLMVGLLVLPGQGVILKSCLFFKPVFCLLYSATNYNVTFVCIYNISLIAVDRYLALSDPFMYSQNVSLLLTSIITALMWIWSLVYNFALMYFNGSFSFQCLRRCYYGIDDTWQTVDLVVVFIFPCAIIIVLYMRIFCIARKHIVAIRLTQRDRNGTNSMNKWESSRSERKAGRALGLVVLVFFVSLIPYFICALLFDFDSQSDSSMLMITAYIYNLNSAINPVIYALYYPWFQKSVKMILSLHICRAGSSLINLMSCDSK